MADKESSATIDCMRMLKSQFDIFLTFPLSEDDINDEDITSFTQFLSEGRKDRIYGDNIRFPKPRPLSVNVQKSFVEKDDFSAIYLLNDYNVDKVKENGLLLFAGVGEEFKTLYSLIIRKDIFQFHDELDIGKEIKKWCDLDPFVFPCTDIILVDRYVFSSPDKYATNAYDFLKTLARHSKNTPVNIVIFTLKSTGSKKNNTYFEPDWDDIIKEIKKKFKKQNQPKVTIIAAKDVEELEVHDRYIFTNYRAFKSGDTLNYFDENGNKITRGLFLDVSSLADYKYYQNAMNFIEKMQGIINHNAIAIKGDRVCNYLSFRK